MLGADRLQADRGGGNSERLEDRIARGHQQVRGVPRCNGSIRWR